MRQPTGDDTLAGYVRQSIADIVPTATLRAAPINAEYNKLRDAFAVSSGHKHDGSTGEGGYIPLIGDVDALNKVVIDTSNNRVGVFVEVSSAAVEQVRFQDGVIVPVTTNDIDLGSSSAKFKDLHLQGTATIATVDINAGNIDGTIIGASSPTTATFTSATLNNNLTVTGTSTLVGTTTITSVDLNSGAIDNAVIGSATPVAGTFTTLNANTSLVAATADINGGTLDGATVGASVPSTGAFTTLTASGTSTLTTVDINGGNIDGTVIGASTATTGSFTTLSTSGQATLATADINGGSIDGSTIGASSASTGAFTTLTSSGGITGNVTGNLTGNVTGNVTGDVTGNVTGNLTGNVTAGSGTSTFTNLVVNGNLNMNAGTSATITNLTAPSADLDAATKKYVDDEISGLIGDAGAGLDTLGELADALNDDDDFSTTVTNSIATKLPKAGGTMTGAIAMSTNKITGAGDPTSAQDVATKAYTDAQRDTRVAKTGDTMSGALAMGNNKITGLATPTAGTDVTNKTYVDAILGSATVAATSATNAATSETNAATSATNAATSETNAATSATNAASSYDQFDDRYLGAKSSAPTVDNDGDALITGALYFNSTSNIMYVYGGSGWQAAGSSVNGTSERTTYTATAGQTVFAAAYDTGYIDVYLNGVKLLAGTDFTATNGTSITLASGASVNDVVDIVAYGTFVLADHYTKTASDARYVEVAGDTMTGNLSFGDNDKAIFGAGSDLQIYHDGSNSYIREQGTGDLFIQGGANIIFEKTGGEDMLTLANDGSVVVKYNGVDRIETTSAGIDVTGTVTSDGLTVDGDVLLSDGSNYTDQTVKISTGGATVGNRSILAFADQRGSETAKLIGYNSSYGSGLNKAVEIEVDGSKVARFYDGGDISFYEDTGTTAKFFWDASAERLGLGTATPDVALEVDGGTSNGGIARFHNNGTRFLELSAESDGTYNDAIAVFKKNTSVGQFAFRNSTTEYMRINSSGNVGIGTSSPIYPLHVSGEAGIDLYNSSGGGNVLNFRSVLGDAQKYNMSISSYDHATNGTGSADGLSINGKDGVSIATGTDTTRTERMRIDSSGNLLVGTTDTSLYANTTGSGFHVSSTGWFESAVTNDRCLYLNRMGTDGEIVQFRKDGATVGSIAASGGDLLIGTGDTGIRFVDAEDTFVPFNTNGNGRDNAINIGKSSERFKDLYLSGGVYLGGTGSANKLDDYEEGTFTPVVRGQQSAGTTTGTSYAQGKYTKIGRMVHLFMSIGYGGHTGTGSVEFANFPFVSDTNAPNEANGVLMIDGIPTDTNRPHKTFYMGGGSTSGVIFQSGSAIGWSVLPIQNVSSGFRISVWYHTNQ